MRVDLGPVAQFPPGTMRYVETGGSKVLVCNAEGEYHACAAECPHRGANLSQGQLHGFAVVCPWHDWAFDVRTGQGISNPVSYLKKYQVQVEDGEVVLTTVDDLAPEHLHDSSAGQNGSGTG